MPKTNTDSQRMYFNERLEHLRSELRAERLEHLRSELRAERISYGELLELQSLARYIDPYDVELLEAAGVPEHNQKDIQDTEKPA